MNSTHLCNRAHRLVTFATYSELLHLAALNRVTPIAPDGADLRRVERPVTLALLVAEAEQESTVTDFVAGPLRWPTEAGE
jgi:hypothetical protein